MGLRAPLSHGLIGDRRPILVAVHVAEEGRNRLLQAFASLLGDRLALPVDEGIV